MGGIAGSIAGGVIGGIGKKKAAKQARRDSAAAQARLQPFADAGASATGALQNMLLGGSGGEGLQQFRDSMGFRDATNRALRGVAANGAARGLLGSTGTGERFQRTAAEIGNQTYNSFLDRLFGLSSQGAQAASGQANLQASQPQSKGSILGGLGQGISSLFG